MKTIGLMLCTLALGALVFSASARQGVAEDDAAGDSATKTNAQNSTAQNHQSAQDGSDSPPSGIPTPQHAQDTGTATQAEEARQAGTAKHEAGQGAAPPPPTVPFAERIAARVVQSLKSTGAGSRSIAAYYRALGSRLLWVDENGVLPAARAVAAEIRRADEWGLDARAFRLPDLEPDTLSDAALAHIEGAMSRAAVTYARHARGARVDRTKLSRFIDRAASPPSPRAVLDALATAPDKAARLRTWQPQHPQFLALKARLAKLRQQTLKGSAPRLRLPPGPVLRKGMRHPHVALLRRRLGLAPGATPKLFDSNLEDHVKKAQRAHGLRADGIVGRGTRQALNGDGVEKQIVKLLINMERWRSLPEPLDRGTGIYVWANIPEFRIRIMQGNKAIFSERAIVGLLNKQTPVFSDQMEWIEFHPTWYVPASIIREDILPSLRRPTSTIVKRYHLRIDCGAAGRDPASIDWHKTDIRKCRVTQPPGPKSVLGDFKFKFPNRHAVYMHDTLTRRLFSANIRTFSHGCIRVKNPRRMAELLLTQQNIMSKSRIDAILAGPRRETRARFKTPVPVHITYLTALLDDKGRFITRPDYYGHDRRLAQALLGKGHLIDPAPVARRSTYRPKPRPKKKKRHWADEVLYN